MDSFFSSLKTERVGKKVYRTRDDARADVFDYIHETGSRPKRYSPFCFRYVVAAVTNLITINLPVADESAPLVCTVR